LVQVGETTRRLVRLTDLTEVRECPTRADLQRPRNVGLDIVVVHIGERQSAMSQMHAVWVRFGETGQRPVRGSSAHRDRAVTDTRTSYCCTLLLHPDENGLARSLEGPFLLVGVAGAVAVGLTAAKTLPPNPQRKTAEQIERPTKERRVFRFVGVAGAVASLLPTHGLFVPNFRQGLFEQCLAQIRGV
jgi:hypothetical protein